MSQNDWIEIRGLLSKHPEKGFECLYNQLWEKLLSVAFNYVRDKATAQEIVQDVFVALWLKRERLASVDNITPFAMRAIQNRIYDHFDRQAVQERYILRVSKTDNKTANSTQHQLDYEETFTLIDTEIDRLPDTTKKIFRLSRFDRFTNEEIASSLHVSVKAVEYHITQALKHLRLKLKYVGVILIMLLGLR